MSSTAPGMKQMHEGEVKTGEMKRAHRVLTRYPQGTQGVLRGCSEGTQIAQEMRKSGIWSGFRPISAEPFQSSSARRDLALHNEPLQSSLNV